MHESSVRSSDMSELVVFSGLIAIADIGPTSEPRQTIDMIKTAILDFKLGKFSFMTPA